MPRYPRLWLACRLAQRGVDRSGLVPIETRRAAEQAAEDAAVTPVGDGPTVSDHWVGPVRVRSYRPPGDGLPVHLLAHGGSFCTGTLNQVDALARLYAARAGCVVLSIDYRLAPEHRWPTAAEDYYSALAWAWSSASALGVDASRLSVGGVSAGAGLAAAAALMARDRGGPAIRFQLLEIPQLDLTLSQPSMTRFGRGYLVTRTELERGVTNYCPSEADRRHPYASPVLAENLSGLPPAFVLTSEYDPLRDEGERFAARLLGAGVPTRLVRARGHVHSSTYSAMRSARRYRELTAGALRAVHAEPD